ncbi:MAG: hypothetical protein KUG62_11450 [Rhodobacteraceae bacterium]|nr:hypothetical protein [Paracoccaceae bacterium]
MSVDKKRIQAETLDQKSTIPAAPDIFRRVVSRQLRFTQKLELSLLQQQLHTGLAASFSSSQAIRMKPHFLVKPDICTNIVRFSLRIAGIDLSSFGRESVGLNQPCAPPRWAFKKETRL